MKQTKYHDTIQANIEANLLHAWKNYKEKAMYDTEQIIGATMLYHNIFYDEAKERVEQAIKSIHTS